MSLSIGVVTEETFEHNDKVEEDLEIGEKSGGWPVSWNLSS